MPGVTEHRFLQLGSCREREALALASLLRNAERKMFAISVPEMMVYRVELTGYSGKSLTLPIGGIEFGSILQPQKQGENAPLSIDASSGPFFLPVKVYLFCATPSYITRAIYESVL